MHFHGRAAAFPEPGSLRQALARRRRVRSKDQPIANGRASDAVAVDQTEYQVRGVARGHDQTLADLRSEVAQYVVLVVLEVGHHLAEVAARGAPADLLRLQHERRNPALRQM